MRRAITFIGLVALLTCVYAPLSSAAVKSGLPCTKVKAEVVISGFKYTCIKVSKKLVWSKGIKVTNPAPSVSPTPTSTPKPSQTPTPTSTPKPSQTPTQFVEIPTSFEDLWEKRKGLIYSIWWKSTQEIKNNKSVLPPVEIFRGPNTPTYISEEKLINALDDVSRMYSSFPMPKKVQIFYYSRADLEWGIDKAKAVMGVEYQNVVEAHGGPIIKCNVPNDCDDGDAYVGSNGVAYMAVGLSVKPDSILLARAQSGQTETTEFYHTIQENFYAINKTSKPNVNGLNPSNKPPHWLSIGGENITSQLITDKSNYESFHQSFPLNEGWVKYAGIDFTPEWIDQYLSISNLNNMWSNNRFGPPSTNAALMGQQIVGIMVALKGPSAMLDFHRDMSAGESFERTFQSIFGQSWNSAAPTIGRIIYDMYKNKY